MIQIKRGSGNFTDYLNDWQTIETQNLVVGHKSPMSIKLSITTPIVQEISSGENCVFRLLIRVINQLLYLILKVMKELNIYHRKFLLSKESIQKELAIL